MPRGNIIVSHLKSSDIPDAALIEQKSIHEPWNENALCSAYNNKASILLGAYDGTSLCGFVNAGFVLDEVSIFGISVLPDYRGQGIGTMLISELCKEVKAFAAFITLEVRESNIPAQKLYERSGFSVVGIRRNFYSSPSENALLMTKFFNTEE